MVRDARSKACDVLLFRHDAATGTGLATPNCLLKITGSCRTTKQARNVDILYEITLIMQEDKNLLSMQSS